MAGKRARGEGQGDSRRKKRKVVAMGKAGLEDKLEDAAELGKENEQDQEEMQDQVQVQPDQEKVFPFMELPGGMT